MLPRGENSLAPPPHGSINLSDELAKAGLLKMGCVEMENTSPPGQNCDYDPTRCWVFWLPFYDDE